MPISEDHAGRSYPATQPYVVSRAKIREFATALADLSNPAYSGESPVAPPTFAVVLATTAWEAMFADPELELSLSRTVHVDQGFTWVRPLKEGEEVVARLRIEKVRTRGASAIISIAVEVATTAGEVVCTATSTLLHTNEEAA